MAFSGVKNFATIEVWPLLWVPLLRESAKLLLNSFFSQGHVCATYLEIGSKDKLPDGFVNGTVKTIVIRAKMACVNTSVALKVKINIVRNEAGALEQRSARDRVPENFKSPRQSQIVKSRNSASRSQSRIPDFRILSPCPGRGSWIFWFWVPVPFVPLILDSPGSGPAYFLESHSQSQSRIQQILNLSPGTSPGFYNESRSRSQPRIL